MKTIFKGVFDGKKVLITGNTGFKGSWLSSWLCKLGADVYGVSKDVPTTPAMFEILNLSQKVRHYQADLRDASRINEIFTIVRPDFLFHLAAQPIVSRSYENPLETLSSNIMGTANVLECLRKSAKPCTAVLITSDKCYDNVEWEWGYRENDPLGGKDIYSGSKGAAELVCKSFYHSFFKERKDIRMATARAGNVIGGGDWGQDRLVPDCMRAWSVRQVVPIRFPDATRPWQHVMEPLSGYLALALALAEDNTLSGSAFNFGPRSGQVHTVLEMIQALSTHWAAPMDADFFSLQPETSFHEAGLLKLNCDQALFHLKWQPTLSFNDFIEMTGAWYNAYYNHNANMTRVTEDQIDWYVTVAREKGMPWAL